jgi:hypothetical protein
MNQIKRSTIELAGNDVLIELLITRRRLRETDRNAQVRIQCCCFFLLLLLLSMENKSPTIHFYRFQANANSIEIHSIYAHQLLLLPEYLSLQYRKECTTSLNYETQARQRGTYFSKHCLTDFLHTNEQVSLSLS